MRNKYFLIVCSLRQSSWATSRLLSPSATRATTCSSRGVRSFTPKALTIREGRHLRDHFNQILQLLTIRPHLAMVHALYALAEQAERILGKSEQPFGPGAEGVGHEVSVVGTQQENLCHLGVRQMQSAKHGHVRPAVLGMIGVQDCDLHTRGGDCVEH